MGQDTEIGWCDDTFNPVRGCQKVGPGRGCEFCYAELLSKRNPATLGEWGPKGVRAIAAESYWKNPAKWNRMAKEAGEKRKVFCASLGDIGEDRPEWLEPRKRLMGVIRETPWLEWLMLTKRPENIEGFFPEFMTDPPENVIWGTSVEDQQCADLRIPHLVRLPGKRFVSCEPLLGPVNLEKWLGYAIDSEDFTDVGERIARGLQWVIVGGESGPNARPMHPQWARDIRNQCKEMTVPYFFKQWGRWLPWEMTPIFHCIAQTLECRTLREESCKGPGWRQLDEKTFVQAVGKKAAGNYLGGVQYLEFPEITVPQLELF